MYAVIKKEDEEAVCRGCLSTNRRLTPLTNYDLYFVLLDTKELIEDYKYLNILLCWECTALLRRTQVFRRRLQHAQYTLAHDKQICTSTLSTLKHDHKQDYDYIIEETIELKPNIDQFLDNHVEIDIKEDIDNCETDNHFENYVSIIIEKEDKIKKVTKNLKNKKQREKQDLKKIDNSLDVNNLEDIDNFETDNHFENYDNYKEDKIKKVTKNIKNKKQDLKKTDDGLDLNKQDIHNFETDNHFENYDDFEKTKIKKSKTIKIKKVTKKYKQKEKQDLKKIDNGLDLNNPDNYFSPSCLSEMEIEELLERERDDRDAVGRPQKCATCGFRFASKTELYDHRRIDHRRRSTAVKCPHCAIPFRTHWDLELHCWRSHPVNRCSLCGRVVARDKDRAKHLEQHKYSYRCIKCDVDFENKQLFSYHQKELHTKYICDDCGHTNATKKSLESHIVRHHLPHKCPSCPLIFSTWHRLYRHARASHGRPGEEAYCVECDISFPNRAKYNRHLSQSQRHTPKKKISVPCPECGKVFSRKTYMNNHMKLLHFNQSRHHCQFCDKYFVNGFTLRSHIKYVHDKIQMPKTKICSVCGRGFGTNRVLENHMRTHTGERPFACAHCAAAFAQRVALKAHLAAIHKEK